MITWISIWIVTFGFINVYAGPTLRYSSGCSVDLCELVNKTNGSNSSSSSCSQPPPCYRFESSTNLTFCGPQVICSLFDTCISGTRCASNTSVCIVNTCCSVPICMPLSLTASCNMYTTNAKPISYWSNKICPNATWSENGTVVPLVNYNNSFGLYGGLGDFVLDRTNNIYLTDTSNYRIVRVAANDSTTSIVVSMSSSSYISTSIFIDNNGTIFSAESWSSYSSTYYRVVKYTQNGGSMIVFGPTTCGSSLNELCGTNSISVDQNGNIYYSDSSQNRVVRFSQYASSATLIAGISGSSGSQLNQLNNPSGIFLDSTNTLYVADQNNYRVMKFTSGNSIGTILFTLASYQSPLSLIVDNAGSVYVGTSSGVHKWVPGSTGTSIVFSTMYWGANHIRMDTFGNLFTSGYSISNLFKYNITSNSC